MRKASIEDLKKSKYFTLWDLIPYLCVLVVAITLLLVFLLPAKSDMTGFFVVYGESEVMSYDFEEDRFDIAEDFSDNVNITPEKGGYIVKIYNKDGYNVFFVDIGKKTLKMVNADCSFSQDCTYMPAIEKSGDSIICVPHKLKIIANGDDIGSPVTG